MRRLVLRKSSFGLPNYNYYLANNLFDSKQSSNGQLITIFLSRDISDPFLNKR